MTLRFLAWAVRWLLGHAVKAAGTLFNPPSCSDSILYLMLVIYLFIYLLIYLLTDWLGSEQLKTINFSPGWYGSVDWVPACEPRGCQFDSQSGHVPGWWDQVTSWGCARGNRSTFPSHITFLFLPPPLPKKTKIFFESINQTIFLSIKLKWYAEMSKSIRIIQSQV